MRAENHQQAVKQRPLIHTDETAFLASPFREFKNSYGVWTGACNSTYEASFDGDELAHIVQGLSGVKDRTGPKSA